MRLDDLLIFVSTVVCCGVSTFSYGLLFQSISIVVLAIVVYNTIVKRQSQIAGNLHGTRASSVASSSSSSSSSSSAYVPVFYHGAVGLIFPLLLAAEKIYHLNHSVGYNTIPLYASLVWLWVALTEEERTKIAGARDDVSPLRCHLRFGRGTGACTISVDRRRFDLVVVYTICMGILLALLTMNVHLGLGCAMFSTSAYITETLLRTLFHQHRIALRSTHYDAAASADEIRVVDSEIHLVSTFVGWFMCDFASNPFQENSVAESTSRRTVVTASPEMIVGRTFLVAAWIGIILFSLHRMCNSNGIFKGKINEMKEETSKEDSNNGNNNNNNNNNKTRVILQFFGLIAFVGLVSLLLTGWTCADCFRRQSDEETEGSKVNGQTNRLREERPSSEQFVQENQQLVAEELALVRNVTLSQRLQRTLQSFKQFVQSSATFTNPFWIWYNLLFDHSRSSSSTSSSATSASVLVGGYLLPLRIVWILVWACLVPLLSAFPFIIKTLSPPTHQRVPRIVWRKWFHFVAVASFLITTMTDGSFMALAWSGALALTALIEVGRICEVPPFGKLTPLLESVTDDRDALVLRTHWYLMLGCALPVIFFHRCVYFWSDNPHWLVYAAVRILPGLGCLGIGDAMSAVLGTLYGFQSKSKWASLFSQESTIVAANPVLRKKSTVGTIYGGFVASLLIVAVGIYAARLVADWLAGLPFSLENKFLVNGEILPTVTFWLKATSVLAYGAAYETVSGGVDNLEVPLLSLAVTFLTF